MEKQFYTVKELSDRWSYSPSALKKWRDQDKGPDWTRRGYRLIIYPADAVYKFEQENPYLLIED